MSGFTIPGLGFAKPNEKLPPLPPDVLAAAASLEGTSIKDATPSGQEAGQAPSNPPEVISHETAPSAGDNNTTATSTQAGEVGESSEGAANETQAGAAEETQSAAKEDASDPAPKPPIATANSAPSPPSLTDALEAALGQPEAMEVDSNNIPEATATLDGQAGQQPGAPGEGENPEWEVDSSPYESSSESSSSDSSSDDEDDKEGYELLGVEETARLLMEGGSDDEGEGGKQSSAAQLRTKNEVAAEAIPKPEVTITPDMKIEELGFVEKIIDNIMVIKAFTPGEYQVLDSGSVLCTEDRNVFGVVAETIGQVLQPMYTVLFSKSEEIKEAGIEQGTKVYYPVDHASYVFTQPLRNLKGSDASNIHDEEVAEDEMEFSDDEREAEHKRQVKQKRKKDRQGRGDHRGGKEPHPLRHEVKPDGAASGALNYDDDDDDGPYRPLARPASFVKGPPIQQDSTLEPEPGTWHSAHRGRRGDFRNRGQRGRGDRSRGGRGGRGGGGGGGGSSGYHHRPDSRDGYSLPPNGYQSGPSQAPYQQPSPNQYRHEAGASQWAGQPFQGAGAPSTSSYQSPTNNAPPIPAFNFSPQAQASQQQAHTQSQPPQLPLPFQFPLQGQAAAQPGVSAPPPWPVQPQQQQHQSNPGAQATHPNAQGAFVNPALIAALLAQMQQNQANGGQPPAWGRQAPPPAPPQ